ncbi:MAG: hypothetical protein AB2L13_18510 [Spirochaetota bacterium]
MNINKIIKFIKIFKLKKLQKSQDLRIVVGSGGICEDGWIGTDIDVLNVIKENDWKLLFEKNSIYAILAEHVWEHLTLQEGRIAARICYNYLKNGGYIRLAVPDGLNPDGNYINNVKPGGNGQGASDHKILYTYHTIQDVFLSAGFKVKLLEYYTENGNFYYEQWNPEDGKIIRSKRFDPRNTDSIMKYNSIILDAIKPC